MPPSPTPPQEVAASLRRELDLEARLAPYRPHRWQGARPAAVPTLHLDDVSAIPFLSEISGVEEYQHRARLRAGSGDLFAAVTDPTPGYEAYCRRLGLGEAGFVRAEPLDGRLAVAAACAEGETFERLCRWAAGAGTVLVHPYMGIEEAWRLAARLASASGARVQVVGPPPPVTWIANDKATFEEIVRRTLGDGWTPESDTASTPETMTRTLVDLASRHPWVALKRLRCASAMGNRVFSSSTLLEAGPEAVERRVRAFLRRTEWVGDEEVLVVAWEEASLSPSTQLWIPAAGCGPPRLEGVYQQILAGSRRVFVGSRPARLAPGLRRRLEEAALAVGTVLQELGYVGRCSFDHLVVDGEGEDGLRFVECNGRWGGTSTPMALVDRLIPGSRPPYRAQDFEHPDLAGVAFTEVLEAVEEELFVPGPGTGRFIFYNVGPLARAGKLDVIALGRHQEEAEEALEEILPRLLGLSPSSPAEAEPMAS